MHKTRLRRSTRIRIAFRVHRAVDKWLLDSLEGIPVPDAFHYIFDFKGHGSSYHTEALTEREHGL